MRKCQWCHGTGRQYVEQGSSLCYECPDCGGSGMMEVCEICGEEYTGDFCENCFAKCEECFDICPIDEMTDGYCPECAEWLKSEKGA